MQSVTYLVQQGVRRTLLQARWVAAWLAMVCSFRGPSSRILWQRWLCTCCTRPSLPYSTAASWLIVALLPLGLISKYRSKTTKQPCRVNTTLLSLSYPSFLGVTAYFIASATIKKYRSRISRKSPLQKSRLPSPTNYDISFNIPVTVSPLVPVFAKTLGLFS